jgi:hypothetical protein
LGLFPLLDQLIETAKAIKPIVDFVAGIGLATVFGAVLLAVLKRNAQLRQWRNFKDDLEDWADKLLSTHKRHPKELLDEEWKSECESMLYDAQFTPSEITQIIDLAIIVAKANTLDLLDTRER